jgi:oligoribonuclease (3'-5' exoribonuclease)
VCGVKRLQPAYLFLDIETTGMDSRVDQITELAWILEAPDMPEQTRWSHAIVEHYRLPTPWVLEKTDYLTRILPAPKTPLDAAMTRLVGSCHSWAPSGRAVHLVGCNPSFDDSFLKRQPFRNYYSHRLIDVECLVMNWMDLTAPVSRRECSEMMGLPASTDPHTAMGDTREVRELLYKCLGFDVPALPERMIGP